jgi:hypothetical protein
MVSLGSIPFGEGFGSLRMVARLICVCLLVSKQFMGVIVYPPVSRRLLLSVGGFSQEATG